MGHSRLVENTDNTSHPSGSRTQEYHRETIETEKAPEGPGKGILKRRDGFTRRIASRSLQIALRCNQTIQREIKADPPWTDKPESWWRSENNQGSEGHLKSFLGDGNERERLIWRETAKHDGTHRSLHVVHAVFRYKWLSNTDCQHEYRTYPTITGFLPFPLSAGQLLPSPICQLDWWQIPREFDSAVLPLLFCIPLPRLRSSLSSCNPVYRCPRNFSVCFLRPRRSSTRCKPTPCILVLAAHGRRHSV